MTTSELKKAIAESQYAKMLNSITVTFEFPYLNYKNEVKGLSAIYQFANNQIKAFKDQKYKEVESHIQKSINYYNRIIDEILRYNLDSNNIPEGDVNLLEANLTRIISDYKRFSPFINSCPEIEFLVDVKNKYPKSFNSAYEFIIGNPVNLNGRDSFFGYMLAFNFINRENADLKRIELDKKVISESKKFFNQYLTESESQLSEFLNESSIKYNEHITNLQNFKDEKQSSYNEWFGKSTESFSAFFTESTEKIKTLNNTYEELLRLKKPAEYWKLRADGLKKQGWRSLYWLIGLVLFTALMLFALLWLTPDDMLITIFSDDKSKAIRWSIVFLAFLSVLIYGIRTLNKVTFSSFHLARDAEEREQLTYVYLSLINENAMDKEDRLLIMQSLFSRADTGLLKDDSSPSMPGAASVVEKIIK